MVLSCKSHAVQVHIYEGNEPPQFRAIFQRFIVFKGGHSSGYKKFISENDIVDDTYQGDGTALFRIQGSGPDSMQTIQVDAVASSLNSSYCFILHVGNAIYTWAGNLTSSVDHDLLERQLDLIKPNLQYKPQKEGAETVQFWDILGGKSEYPNEKIAKQPENDPHLFYCSYAEGTLKVEEIFTFNQDDLMTEDIFILDCQSEIFVWVGQQVASKSKLEAFNIGKKFLECDILMEKLSRETPIFIVTEGSEPQFFTRFFTWDSSKTALQVHGNSYQRKLAIVKNGVTPVISKSKQRLPMTGAKTEMHQRSRSVSSALEKPRPRGRSPAFNAIASTFENPNARNFSTPPSVSKIYPKSSHSDTTKTGPQSAAIAALTSSFESVAHSTPQSSKARIPVRRTKAESLDKGNPSSSRHENLTISEDAEEKIKEEGLPTYPYECLITSSTNPVTDIDVTKREAYLSATVFKEKFNMSRSAFYKLPKWKQNKLKIALNLF